MNVEATDDKFHHIRPVVCAKLLLVHTVNKLWRSSLSSLFYCSNDLLAL